MECIYSEIVLHMHMVLHTERTSVLPLGHGASEGVTGMMSESATQRGTIETLPTRRRMKLRYIYI
jgi:spermidine synthase